VVGSTLYLSELPITNLHGLSGLTALSSTLWIEDNDALQNLAGLDNLSYVGNTVRIERNPKLCRSEASDFIEGLSGFETQFVSDNDEGC